MLSLPSFRAQSRNLPCTLLFLAPFAKGFPFPAVSHRTLYQYAVISSVARNLPCTPSFLAPFAERFSPFPLSHIRHYPLLQERSLDFARDDDTGIALSKYIRCTLREINPFSPPTVISNAARNLPCTLFFLAPFAKGFPFPLSHIQRYTSVPERSLGFARDDDTEMVFSKHIRCTLREINPFFPHRHFERSEKSSLHSALSCFLRRSIPLFRYHTYGAIPVCQKDPSTSLGMTMRE